MVTGCHKDTDMRKRREMYPTFVQFNIQEINRIYLKCKFLMRAVKNKTQLIF